MKRFSLVAGVTAALVTAVLLLVAVGPAGATSWPAQHYAYSSYWDYNTGVRYDTSKVDVCAAFPGGVFFDVSLTTQTRETLKPINPPVEYRFTGIETVSGVINASDGTYNITGGPFTENRVGPIFQPFFTGSGRLAISGPGGTVVGTAILSDITADNGGMDFEFTRITSCQLN